MVRKILLAGGGLCIALLTSTAAGAGDPPPPAKRTILDGIYTAEQVAYGENVFYGSCKRCHSTTEWEHESFLRARAGLTVYDLYREVLETMPRGRPGSLTYQEYVDVTVYLLSRSGLPVGDRELGIDPDTLQSILIVQPDTAAPDSGSVSR